MFFFILCCISIYGTSFCFVPVGPVSDGIYINVYSVLHGISLLYLISYGASLCFVSVGPVVDAQHDLDKPPTPTGCLHCEEEFTDLTSLNSHVQTKHAQTPAETVKGNACTQCGASFADKSQFEKHMTLHYPTPQVCKICKKTFANVYRLQRHMISHEESNELRKFKCSECGKAFKFKHHLKEHTRIHSGEKPFECSNCGKRFSHSGSYSSHMTSKKCWVVNMRMSKPGVKTSPEKQQSSPDGLLRPLIPKSHQENGLDINPVTTSSLYPSCVYPPQYMPFDPTGRHLPTQLLNQLCNGNSPFTPPIPYGMINPLLQGQFGISPALIAEQESKIKQLVKAAEKNNHVKAEVGVKVDENQNAETEELKDAVKIKKEKMEEVQENGEDLSEKENEGQDENSLGETPPHMDLDAVKKVLEIVDATVNQQQQQQQIEEKTKLSKLVASTSPRGLSMLATAASEQLKQLEEDEDKSDNKSGSLQCRHCQEICTGPIDLHQHERYLCKNNKDISPSSDREGDKSLCNGSTSPVSSCTERMEDEGDDMEDGQNDRDFKRGRARSFITDEQQTFLRGRYHINPFPSKADLQTIADHTRLAKRVVQVWFQNMRARDRRRGKPLPDMSQVSPGVGSTLATVPTTMPPSSYIPIVPQVSFRSTLAGSSNLYKDTEVKVPTTSQHTSPSVPAYSMPVNINYSMQAEPLDLSVGKQSPQKPGRLHSVKPYHVNDHHDSDEEILNLSTKKHDQEERTSPNPAALEDSPIFRYMKREGILPNGKPSSPVAVPTPVMTSHLVPVTRPLAINTTPAHSSRVCTTGTLSICGPLSEKPVSPDPHITMTSTPLPQHHALHHHQQQQRSPSIPPGSPSVMSSSLDTSYGSSLGLDGSLDSKPPKRARRKSWRQVGEPVSTPSMGRCFSRFYCSHLLPLDSKGLICLIRPFNRKVTLHQCIIPINHLHGIPLELWFIQLYY